MLGLQRRPPDTFEEKKGHDQKQGEMSVNVISDRVLVKPDFQLL